jgi:hypothetical protein
MRSLSICLLGALAAGCSSHSGSDSSVLMAGTRLGVSGKVHRVGPREAVLQALSARGSWSRDLKKAAQQAPGVRFASPSRDVLLARLERESKAHDFEIVSLKMLRPKQLAPVIVVRTSHYVALARAMDQIEQKLIGRHLRDYEGFYFEARDETGVPFFACYTVMRGRVEGGEWARSEPLFPFEHG